MEHKQTETIADTCAPGSIFPAFVVVGGIIAGVLVLALAVKS